MTVYYKCTLPQGGSVHGFSDAENLRHWPLPQAGTPGAWKTMHPGSKLKPHFGGLHLAPKHLLIRWLREEIYIAEPDTNLPVAISMDCLSATRARLVRQLHLPVRVWQNLMLQQAWFAYHLVKALVYPYDILRRLENAIEMTQSKNYPDTWGPYDDVWHRVRQVEELCQADQYSGIETNLNVTAALQATKAIYQLKAGTGTNSSQLPLLVRQQAAHLSRALSGLVEDLIFRHGTNFNPQQIPCIAQDFLKHQPDFPMLHHAVGYNLTQHLNNRLIKALNLHNPA